MTEARAWRTVGGALMAGAVWAGGFTAFKFGLRPETTILLGLDMGAAFIAMAGAAAFICGKVMAVAEGGDAACASRNLRIEGLAIGILGALVAGLAVSRAGLGTPSINQLWLGMAGSSLVLAGIMAFLAHRVLAYLAASKPAAKAAAAS